MPSTSGIELCWQGRVTRIIIINNKASKWDSFMKIFWVIDSVKIQNISDLDIERCKYIWNETYRLTVFVYWRYTPIVYSFVPSHASRVRKHLLLCYAMFQWLKKKLIAPSLLLNESSTIFKCLRDTPLVVFFYNFYFFFYINNLYSIQWQL